LGRHSFPERIKKRRVQLIGLSRPEAHFQLLEHVGELLTVNEFDCRRTVPNRFLASVGSEGASGDDDAFVGVAQRLPSLQTLKLTFRNRHQHFA
jgi:hypothetical protein